MMASPFWWDRSTGHPFAIGSRRRESCFAWPVCIVILLTVFPFGIAQSQVIDPPRGECEVRNLSLLSVEMLNCQTAVEPTSELMKC